MGALTTKVMPEVRCGRYSNQCQGRANAWFACVNPGSFGNPSVYYGNQISGASFPLQYNECAICQQCVWYWYDMHDRIGNPDHRIHSALLRLDCNPVVNDTITTRDGRVYSAYRFATADIAPLIIRPDRYHTREAVAEYDERKANNPAIGNDEDE